MSLQLLNIRFRQVYCKISEQTTNFFSMTTVLFGLLIFFREIMPESWGCGLYTSLYGKCVLSSLLSLISSAQWKIVPQCWASLKESTVSKSLVLGIWEL